MKFHVQFRERCANPELFSADIEASDMSEALQKAEEIGRCHLDAVAGWIPGYGYKEAGLDILAVAEDGLEVRASLEPDLGALAEEVQGIVESYEGDWLEFAKHLEEIEEEAEVARLCARRAIDEVGWGDFLAALKRIEDAEAHEANYGDSPVWSACRREVEAAIRGLDYTFVRR